MKYYGKFTIAIFKYVTFKNFENIIKVWFVMLCLLLLYNLKLIIILFI